MKQHTRYISIIFALLLCFLSTQKTMANCSSCNTTTDATTISSSFNGEVICITGTPSGDVTYNISHADVTLRVCADDVTFNGLNISQSGAAIEVFGNNTAFGQLNINDDGFRLYSYAPGTEVNGSIQTNGTFDFQALSGGILSLPNFTADSDGEVIAQDGGEIISQGMTLNSGFTSILVNTGGSMTIDNSFTLNNNGELVNRDTVTITGDLTYQSTGNSLINECGESVFNVEGEFDHNNGPIINRGTFDVNSLRVNNQSGMDIQMDNGALFKVELVTTFDRPDLVSFVGDEENCATFEVANINNWNNELTADTNIYYCGPTSGANTGDATISCDDCGDTRSLNFCNPVLPVTFASVKVKHTVEGNVLQWSTATEKNSDYFIIQRSAPGSSFTEIGRVDAAGDATHEIDYHFIDDGEECTQCAYRIKQVDYDGSSMFSKVVGLNVETEEEATVYPNPGNFSDMKLEVSGEEPGNYHVAVYDMMGTLKGEGEILVQEEGNVFALAKQFSLKPGNYIVAVELKESVQNIKLQVH